MKVNCEKTERRSGMKKLLCTIQDTPQMIQIKKRLDQNHINYSGEPIKSNFLSDLVHMIFYRTVGNTIQNILSSAKTVAGIMWNPVYKVI